jgi:hypothetical protein
MYPGIPVARLFLALLAYSDGLIHNFISITRTMTALNSGLNRASGTFHLLYPAKHGLSAAADLAALLWRIRPGNAAGRK